MTSRIKPGLWCLTRPTQGSPIADQWKGKVVKALEPVGTSWRVDPPIRVNVPAPGISLVDGTFVGAGRYRFHAVREDCLIPLNDPDADLSEETAHPLAVVAAKSLNLDPAEVPLQ